MHKLTTTATLAALSLMTTAAGATGDWSGFHVDGHADAGWLSSRWSGFDGCEGFSSGCEGASTFASKALAAPVFDNTVHFRGNNSDTGWGGGLGIGYNFQSDNLVFGVVGDWTWMNASDTKVFDGPGGPDAVSTHVNSVGTLRGLVGFAGDTVMPYITGGWAWGDVNRRFTSSDGLHTNMDASDGWTAGGGLNFAVGPRTALNLEVLYVDFGSAHRSLAGTDPDSQAELSVKTHMTIARVGVQFRF